eukprot:9416665-Ditylum_brightwellii.AAC.1
MSLKCIIVGNCSKSNAFTFYHPESNKIITLIDFTLDHTLPTGPTFNLKYQHNISHNRLADGPKAIVPLYQPELEVNVIQDPEKKDVILYIPTEKESVYTVMMEDGSIEQHPEHDILPTSSPPFDPTASLSPWIHNNALATIFLPDMQRPKQGFLLHIKDTG